MVFTIEDVVRGVEASGLEGKAKPAAVNEVRGLDEMDWRFIDGLGADNVANFMGGYLKGLFDRYHVSKSARLGVEYFICETLKNPAPTSVGR